MRRRTATFACILLAFVLSACAGSGGTAGSITPGVLQPQAPIGSSERVQIREVPVPQVPSSQIAVGADGSVYFGADGLYRYSNGSFTHTSAAMPPGASDFGSAALVTATSQGTIVWSEDANPQGSLAVFGVLQCSAGGGTANPCPSSYAAVDDSVSFLFDGNGISWASGQSAALGTPQVAAQGTPILFTPAQYSGTMQIVLGSDGRVWGANIEGGRSPAAFFQFAIAGGQVQIAKTLPLPSGDEMNGIAVGPDRRFWFTDGTNNAIGAVTLSGEVAQYRLPTPGSFPNGITVGPDGALWFTETNANRIGRIDTRGRITEYAIPTADALPAGIAATPSACAQQAIWFTEPGIAAKSIAEITF